MNLEIYVCYYCGGLIIFREGDKHQPYHLGSGWDCWKMRNAGYTAGSGGLISFLEYIR